MSNQSVAAPATRRLACARCGNEFACDLNGNCWCMAEAVRLPMPAVTDGDCLCRDCLRAAGGADNAPAAYRTALILR